MTNSVSARGSSEHQRISAGSAELDRVLYVILARKSRLFQGFETLSVILLRFMPELYRWNTGIPGGIHWLCSQAGGSIAREGAVPDVAPFKYRAFLSYSHRDAVWAKWLHRGLEGYRIDKDLVGRVTAHGPVPKTLRPIFRDREDFPAGHSLTAQTLAVLEASQFLIVLCSPNAARSHYVNEEIRRFKALGRAASVIPVIIDGRPGDPQRECFPPAVRFKLDAGGALTEEREDPIAADARPQGDGKEIAKQKIVAGLLGVGLDEILRRAERARKRRNLIRVGAGSAASLIVAAAAVGWTAGLSVTSRMTSAQILNSERDAADICEDENDVLAKYNVPEPRRITVAFECVWTLSLAFDGSAQDVRLPRRVLSAFEMNSCCSSKIRR